MSYKPISQKFSFYLLNIKIGQKDYGGTETHKTIYSPSSGWIHIHYVTYVI